MCEDGGQTLKLNKAFSSRGVESVRVRMFEWPGAGVLGAAAGGGSGGPRHVLYGATEMLTGEQFVTHLAELGRLSGLGPGKLSTQAAAPVTH